MGRETWVPAHNEAVVEHGPYFEGGKTASGRKREMALLSFVVGFDGGELPLSTEIGTLARRPVGPQPARRRPSTFAGWEAGAVWAWEAGEQGSGRQLRSVGEFLLSNGTGGKQSFMLSDDVGRKTK